MISCEYVFRASAADGIERKGYFDEFFLVSHPIARWFSILTDHLEIVEIGFVDSKIP